MRITSSESRRREARAARLRQVMRHGKTALLVIVEVAGDISVRDFHPARFCTFETAGHRRVAESGHTVSTLLNSRSATMRPLSIGVRPARRQPGPRRSTNSTLALSSSSSITKRSSANSHGAHGVSGG